MSCLSSASVTWWRTLRRSFQEDYQNLLSSTAVPTSLHVYSLMTSLILVNGLVITVYEYTFEFPGGQERGSEWQEV